MTIGTAIPTIRVRTGFWERFHAHDHAFPAPPRILSRTLSVNLTFAITTANTPLGADAVPAVPTAAPEPLDPSRAAGVDEREPGHRALPVHEPAAAERPGRPPGCRRPARPAAPGHRRPARPPVRVRLGDVVPAPERVTPVPGADFVLAPDTAILVGGDDARAVAGQLAALLRPSTGYPLPVSDATRPARRPAASR